MCEITIEHLAKDFGPVRAVDDLTFAVEPGTVTGFLGPNGAGKTTTLRCLLGLVAPTGGRARIGGARYQDLPDPIRTVGAALEASSFHPGRTARNHLLVMCAAGSLPDRRADEVLELTGMTEAADRRVGGYSTGMRQRLSLAAALLGDPSCLVLDEPATGLDPAGINWIRLLLRHLAHNLGKTVLVSSHLLSEMEHTADRVVIVSHGRLVREGSLADIVGRSAGAVQARTPDPVRLRDALAAAGLPVEVHDGTVFVSGATTGQVGHLAFGAGVELSELMERPTDLEDVFLELTNGGGPAERAGEPVSAGGPQ